MKIWMVAVVSGLIGAGVATVVQMPGGVMDRAGLVAPGGAIGVQSKGDKGITANTGGNGIKTEGGGGATPKGDKGIAQMGGGSGI
jgi:hypothetical protein